MIEDMTIRGFTLGTQRGYLAAVTDFTAFLGRAPDGATAEDLRRYQLRMRSNGASATAMNTAVSALRFFFTVTLGRDDAQVLADFENQIAAQYSFDDDAVWAAAAKAAETEVAKAQKRVAAQCQELGIPKRFAPSLGLHWVNSGNDDLV